MYKIVCLGDSITCEWDEPKYPTFWQELLNQQYGSDKTKVISAGVNGETAQDGYYRLQSDVISHHPDLVTVMFGHNEVYLGVDVNSYQRSLKMIIQSLTRSRACSIWLLTPNQVRDSNIAKQYPPYLKAIQAAATEKNVVLINLWSAYNDVDLSKIYTYPDDYVHPNALGHQLIAQFLFKQFIRSNLVAIV